MILKTLENQYRVYLTPDEYETALDCADSRRAHLAIRLMGETSLRVNEVVSDELTQSALTSVTVDGAESWFVPIHGKDTKDRDTDGKRREVWVPASLKREIDQWCDDENRDPSDPLIMKCKRCVQSDIKSTAKHAATQTGNDDWRHVSCHDFRAYFATNLLLRENVGLEVVMELGGWEDRQTLKPYLNAAFKDLRVRALARAGVLEAELNTPPTTLEKVLIELEAIREALNRLGANVTVDRASSQAGLGEFGN
jgi:integrase